MSYNDIYGWFPFSGKISSNEIGFSEMKEENTSRHPGRYRS